MGFKTECIFYFFCSVLTIVNGIPQRRGSNVCIVSEAGSGLDKPCQFPFVYKDKSYNECTLEDGGGVAWCSTKTIPSTNEHVGGNGHYGDCSQECRRKGNSQQNEDTFEAWLDQNSLG